MFPIVESTNVVGILEALESRSGVFIKDPRLAYLGSETFEIASEVFNSGQKLPDLDEKTMFPNSVNTLPGASRQVIQHYIADRNPVEIKHLTPFMELLSSLSEELTDKILAQAELRYQWGSRTIKDLADKNEWVLNIARYPFTDGNKGQMLFPAHKDWGLMAIYPFINGEGLEVYVDDTYQSLALPDGCLFCYVGDIFARVTDNKVKALLHRVIQPTDEGNRTSIIFYADPIRTMIIPGGKTVGDLIDSKLKKIGQIQ